VIYVGTSGYSYADWKGRYYPAGLHQRDRLEFYAKEFSAVELNFTYYRIPTADQLRKYAAQTPTGFRFTVKAHQEMTHRRSGDPAPFVQLRIALKALQEKRKLGAVLLQFPQSFHNRTENRYYVQHCVHLLHDLPLVVEFRHSDWITKRTLSKLREWGVAFCNVDMPPLPGLLPKTTFVTGPIAYVRFHGRNAGQWYEHEHAWQRYDYTYSMEELEGWVPHLQEMDESAEDLYVFANNHWEGQAATTARQLRMLLGQDVST